MSRYKFNEDEVPYAILEEFGLNQEMIEDLPVDVYRDILNGRLSPVLPIRVTDREGNTVTARARFKLVRDAEDNPDIVFHPRLVRCELDKYNAKQEKKLKKILGESLYGQWRSAHPQEQPRLPDIQLDLRQQ